MKKAKGISRFFLVLLVVMMLWVWSAVALAATGATSTPDHVTLTWASDPTTTQTITWRTDTTVASGVVQYYTMNGRTANPTVTVTAPSCETLNSDLGDMYLHSVTLTGLVPGTKYYYKVGDGAANVSAISSFTTAQVGAAPFKFLIFGDSQSGIGTDPNYLPWNVTVQNAYKANPDARFIVNMGDLCEDGQSYVHWNNWFTAAKGVIEAIPEMPVQGNHETYNLGWKPSSGSNNQPYEFVTQFKVPQNGPVSGSASLKGTVYSFDYGDVHFVYLNSQDVELAADSTLGFSGTLFLDMQKTWLDNDLKSTTKTWKVVFFHKTPYYNKANRTNEDVKAAFLPIIDKYHVDVVFNGHDHGISRTYPMYNDSFVATPAKGTVYYVTGRSGNKYYGDLFKKIWDETLFDATDMPVYIAAQVVSSNLTLNAYKQNGTLLDSYTISKTTGRDIPATVLPAAYTKPQLTVYGQPVGDTSTVPQQMNGKWYIPLKIFTNADANKTYSSSALPAHQVTNTPTYDDATTPGQITIAKLANISSSTLKFTMGGTSASVITSSGTTVVTLTNPITTDSTTGAALIAADDLVKVLTAAAPIPYKFTYKYDAAFNILYVTEDQSAF